MNIYPDWSFYEWLLVIGPAILFAIVLVVLSSAARDAQDADDEASLPNSRYDRQAP